MRLEHNIVSALAADNFVAATQSVQDILGQKMMQSLEDRKMDVAGTLYGETPTEEPSQTEVA